MTAISLISRCLQDGDLRRDHRVSFWGLSSPKEGRVWPGQELVIHAWSVELCAWHEFQVRKHRCSCMIQIGSVLSNEVLCTILVVSTLR